MDEELGAKVPVTRLRRRLSTETEGTQSPLTPSTPTKKRSTRLVKPALELIDENENAATPVIPAVPTVAKKITRRASVRDVDASEETVTPSRRSTRIKSNTSLVVEAVQATDSPRARRALRRASQIGSDTESTTPAKATRRTRKDSTSSVEKLTVSNINEKVLVQVAEPISEEPEKKVKDSTPNKNSNSTPIRKSPRLNKSDNKNNDTPNKNDNATTDNIILTEPASSAQDNTNGKSEQKDIQNISHNSAKLISEINTNQKKIQSVNKSVSAIEESTNNGGNRKRTKSWTTLSTGDPPAETTKLASGDGVMDKNESLNKAMTKSVTVFNTSTDNKENIGALKSTKTMDTGDTITLLEKAPGTAVQALVFMEDSNLSSEGKLTIDMNYCNIPKNEGDDQCVPVIKDASSKRLISENFTVEPMDIDESIPENVTLNDFSDKSNASNDENEKTDANQNTSHSKELTSGMNISSNKSTRTSSISLQQESNNSKRKASAEENNSKTSFNKSDKILLTERSQRKSSISIQNESDDNGSNKSKRKSSLSKAESVNEKRKSSFSSKTEENDKESLNKSKRKSVFETETQNKSSNENKSTLVLSQLKDVSSNENSNIAKSPNDTYNEHTNIPAKETDHNNLNFHKYSTSTPVQQKSVQKLSMQINTSVITPNAEIKNTSKVNKSKTPVKNVSNANHESDEVSGESEDDSRDNSKIIDDEAEEASDDYESGDSRDEEERQYEKDHAIPDKGETLKSEQNLSDDTDYEKDSFVVSSNEEDEDLLSGSGDDLSLSDNELKMTTKSKKKYNERKQKQQKNASKEMFEARHKLNESDKSSKSNNKKSKSRKLESSSSESDEEERKPSKKNRLRIDSSQEVSLNNKDDESVRVTKRKTKRLSESVCEGNTNEKEITICNQSVSESNDPLAEAVKQEPKTPQKDFNMSTVVINEDIEQVEVDNNTTVLKPNETSDPLQATLAQDNEDSESDISENMEIKENYDSVLQNLNKTNNNPKRVKTHDISLNLKQNKKENLKEPIIDQLNLTNIKKPKQNKTQIAETSDKAEESKATNHDKVSVILDKKYDSECSDCIDMRLLFSEDSNDSELNGNKLKPDEKEMSDAKFIPLKRTEAKTNIPENPDEPEDTNVSFFIDTKGDYAFETSIQNSAKKNKKKEKLSISETNTQVDDEANNQTALENISVETTMDSSKKKIKKNKSLDASQTEDVAEQETATTVNSNKKKNKSLDVSQIDDVTDSKKAAPNVILNGDKKRKKKNKSLDASGIGYITAAPQIADELHNNDKKKKKKNKSLDASQIDDITDLKVTAPNQLLNSEPKKKKNKSLDASEIDEITDPQKPASNVLLNSDKKKIKSLDASQISDIAASEDMAQNVSQISDKKKKNKNKSLLENSQIVVNAASEEIIENVFLDGNKKKKKTSQETVTHIDNSGEDSNEAPVEIAFRSEKKSDNLEPVEDEQALTKSKNKFKKKKKKNKSVEPQPGTSADEGNAIKAIKRKRDQDFTTTDGDDIQIFKTQKKKKITDNEEGVNTFNDEATKHKSKKRKATDEGAIQNKLKVFKGNSMEKIHVSRLPDSIISQLDDQPRVSKKQKKVKAISTMPFVVEEGPKRKNKPSTYLEQSVYLNDSISPQKQKPKSSKKVPKVLPFVPTAITSETGYTSKFNINVLPQNIQFVAQASAVPNFRDEFLAKQRVKKLRVEQYKKHKSNRLAKF